MPRPSGWEAQDGIHLRMHPSDRLSDRGSPMKERPRMDRVKAMQTYLPMTETMYYILLSLLEPRHGYGIMQDVEKLTEGRIRLGAGTIYTSLSKLDKDGLILAVSEEERRKIYRASLLGVQILKAENRRLYELYENGRHVADLPD